MRIKYEVSAGGVLLRRRDAGFDAMLIGRGSPRVWTLPKGHVEHRESNEQAAIREVREETGCWGEILGRLNEISYWFYVGKAKHKKSVTFFSMRYLSGDPQNHDHEVDEARWFDATMARKMLKYVNEKRLIDMALESAAEHIGSFELEPTLVPAMEQRSS
ncbi:MAG: NUDIX hydrolase [Candidatus Eremiobacteraeota bacterium]|uniref:NUDIX hydrolase n=1 Tax=mine drainage metagenome TaxID=410659 RepID=E6PH95_9ZZZZ|nr:NUDIX hydrolase [Candidatus Eremiobacteraeota bacterium]